MNLYHRVTLYYRPFCGPILLALLFLLLATGLKLLTPWPLKWVISNVLQSPGPEYYLPVPGGPWEFLTAIAVCAGLLVVIHLFWGLFNLLNNYWLVEIGLRALWRLRTEVFARLQFLPLIYHDHRRSGDSSFRVAYDTQSIQTFFNRGFATVISSGLMLVGITTVLLYINIFLTLVALAVVPFLLAAIYYFAHRIREESGEVQRRESDVLSRVTESLAGIRVVHAFNREEHEVEHFSRECESSLTANRKLTMTQVASSLVIGIITAAGTAALLYFGAERVQDGTIDIGDLILFISYLAMLYQPLEQLSYTVWAMEGAAAGAARVFEVLDADDRVPDAPNAEELSSGPGSIELRNVGFGYDETTQVLKGLTLNVEPGRTVALVGGTGSGKTTILSLVPRFYDIQQGSVLVDGRDVREVTKTSLRRRMSIVLQETFLMNATIRDNIAYGRPGASMEEIEQAASAAQAGEFIRSLPNGYDTEVGERGVRLSGGQRQRLGLARAFLRDSPILLLDEPTSALDPRTEGELMDALKHLMGKPTTLIVAHRLTTVHHADVIHVLQDGCIAESGTGPELLDKRGLYHEMWHRGRAA